MRIGVTNMMARCGKSTCAVNLVCELADLGIAATDRWQGNRRVVLVDADSKGDARRYWSSGRLPVSVEHIPLEASTDIRNWMNRVRDIAVDDVVIDGPSHLGVVNQTIMLVSDLVIIPCSVSAGKLEAEVSTIAMMRETQAARSDRGPACLLVPTRLAAGAGARGEFATALKRLGEPIGPAIHQSAAFARALQAGQWVGEFAPNGTAHEEIKILAVRVRSIALTMSRRFSSASWGC